MAAVQQMPAPGPKPALLPSDTIRPAPVAATTFAMDIDPVSAPISRTVSTSALPISASSSTTGLAIGNKFGSGPQRGESRIVTIVYGSEQEDIVSVFAEVLGKPFCIRPNFAAITPHDKDRVIGIPAEQAKIDIVSRNQALVVAIHAHAVVPGMPPDAVLSDACDYEFLYTSQPFYRRDLCRFISFTLGQINHHETLMAKPRTYFISTTFPDVRTALPNIDILTVGSDAVEIRVDLLQEPLPDGSFARVPSIGYVGEQVMLLRQRTELPILLTTRCTNENGRFPMDDPELFYKYLYRAMQWGVEYIDVELWLPETVRKRLYDRRRNSRIMSAYHDVCGRFRWTSPEARDIYVRSCQYADIVKMINIAHDRNGNFELEYFRSQIRADFPDSPPLSAVNMTEVGQFSRTQNLVFTPITHPLLPVIAAPGQMSAAETNAALSMLGQLPKKNMYGIIDPHCLARIPQAPFYEKCFNELGLPHHFAIVERSLNQGSGDIEAWCSQRDFGGAYLNPAMSCASLVSSKNPFFSSLNGGTGVLLSEAARAIGMVDTIFVRPGDLSTTSTTATTTGPTDDSSGSTLVFDNASWRGILSTLTRDLAPSAYFGRTAVVLASSSDDAASIIFALKALRISKIYTVGFKTPSKLAVGLTVEPFNSLESLQRARREGVQDDAASPFVVISALGPDKGNLVGLLVRIFGSGSSSGSGGSGNSANNTANNNTNNNTNRTNTRKVFLDLASDRFSSSSSPSSSSSVSASSSSSSSRKGDPAAVAEQSGFAVYDAADTTAFTTVEMLRLLVGQNVPYNFVRLAGGRSPF